MWPQVYFPLAPAAELCQKPRMILVETATAADFETLTGECFFLSLGETKVFLRVKSVKRLGNKRQESGREPFSVEFAGAPGLRLPQSIYALENQSAGRLEIFITQLSDGPDGSIFEAIFT